MPQFDLVIVGGGIVGLSTAMYISREYPRLRLLLVEKEASVGRHQTGHNSGVIHSGVYYKPGSLKARLCVQGAAAMSEFCRQHSIPYEICGKLIVATDPDQVPRLHSLLERGMENGIAVLRLLNPEQAREIEPNCAGVAWLHVPSTGITNYGRVCEKYAELAVLQGATVHTSTEVTGIKQHAGDTVVETNRGWFATRYVINCAGLQSDRISRLSGIRPEVQIIPFRGEYYDLAPARRQLIRNLIYPVPDPRFPFLGVHFTRRIGGDVDAGPNAVLAFKREGYKKTDFALKDVSETLTYPGFWRMAGKYWRDGASEVYRSLRKSAFVKALQSLVPAIRSSDLEPNGSGVRAQAVRPDGSLVDDFQFVCSGQMLHVWNVPSPAATASIPIGREIAHMAQQAFGFDRN
jgi:(S)-2-hydroxyglutarate dehydrogenase